MTSRSKQPGSGKEAKKRGRRWFRQLFFRLFLLTAATALVLGVGTYRYGWKPFGQKVPRAFDNQAEPASPAPEPNLDEKIKSAVDKLKEGIEQILPEPEPAATPTPEPKPEKAKGEPSKGKKESGEKSDEQKIKDFLEQQFAKEKKKGKK